ncbi:MAG: RNA polymerase sigma factor [Acidimicrobiia bacterium]
MDARPWYRITVSGTLSERFASPFSGVVRELLGTGDTVLAGNLDKSELAHLLSELRDLGLDPLRIEEEETGPLDDRPCSRPGAGTASAEDLRLADAVRQGDETAFASLLQAHHAALLRLARCYVPGDALAHEVVRRTWSRVVEGIGRFNGRCPLRTWIFWLLVGTAEARGEQSRPVPAPGDDRPAVDPTRFRPDADPWGGHWASPPVPWAGRVTSESIGLVEQVVETLPPGERRVVTLRDVEGWTATEVGQVLGLAGEDQRRLLHRARSTVRAALEERLGATA